MTAPSWLSLEPYRRALAAMRQFDATSQIGLVLALVSFVAGLLCAPGA